MEPNRANHDPGRLIKLAINELRVKVWWVAPSYRRFGGWHHPIVRHPGHIGTSSSTLCRPDRNGATDSAWHHSPQLSGAARWLNYLRPLFVPCGCSLSRTKERRRRTPTPEPPSADKFILCETRNPCRLRDQFQPERPGGHIAEAAAWLCSLSRNRLTRHLDPRQRNSGAKVWWVATAGHPKSL